MGVIGASWAGRGARRMHRAGTLVDLPSRKWGTSRICDPTQPERVQLSRFGQLCRSPLSPGTWKLKLGRPRRYRPSARGRFFMRESQNAPAPARAAYRCRESHMMISRRHYRAPNLATSRRAVCSIKLTAACGWAGTRRFRFSTRGRLTAYSTSFNSGLSRKTASISDL